MNISFYKQGARFYDAIWQGYTRQTLSRTLAALNLKWLSQQEHGRQPVRLLDIACGTGELAWRLNRLHPEMLEITGLDNSPQMLEQARQKLAGSKQAHFVLADATQSVLPFSDASFEAVVFANALHYLSDPDSLLLEVRRTLKPGGQLVVEDFTVHGRFFWPLFERIVLRRLDPQHHKTYTLAELTGLVRKANFTVLDSRNFKVNLIWRAMFVSSVKKTDNIDMSCRK